MIQELSKESIESRLRGRFGRPFRFLDEVGSTNTEALRWAKEGAPEGALVVTNHQTQGRGRWGRSWSSTPGKLLQFSLVLRPQGPPEALGLVTTALAVGCADAIQRLCDLEPTIKWPNDIRLRSRKVAGILAETELSGARVGVVIAGIGINVDWTEDEIPVDLRETTTSLARELGPGLAPPRPSLLAEVLEAFESRYRGLPDSAPSLVEAAAARSDVLGREVTVALATDETVTGTAVRLSPLGELELANEEGLRRLSVGEVARLR